MQARKFALACCDTLRLLPADAAAPLALLAHERTEIHEDLLLLCSKVGRFIRLVLLVVEFLRSKGTVLQQLPIDLDDGIDGLRNVFACDITSRREDVHTHRLSFGDAARLNVPWPTSGN